MVHVKALGAAVAAAAVVLGRAAAAAAVDLLMNIW